MSQSLDWQSLNSECNTHKFHIQKATNIPDFKSWVKKHCTTPEVNQDTRSQNSTKSRAFSNTALTAPVKSSEVFCSSTPWRSTNKDIWLITLTTQISCSTVGWSLRSHFLIFEISRGPDSDFPEQFLFSGLTVIYWGLDENHYKKKPKNEDTLAEAAFQMLARNCTGPFYQDLASITSFHPLRNSASFLHPILGILHIHSQLYSSFDTSIAQPIVF